MYTKQLLIPFFTLLFCCNYAVYGMENRDERCAYQVPLHWAMGTTTSVLEAIQAGRNPMEVDNEGRTPMHWAARCGNLETIEALFQCATIHQDVDIFGRTPLFFAILFDHFDVARLLIRYGGRVNMPYNGQSLILDSRFLGNPNRLRFLLEAGLNPNECETAAHDYEETPLYRICCHGSVWPEQYHNREKLISLLLSFGADPNAVNSWGRCPLSIAAGKSQHNLMRILIQHGACVNVCYENQGEFIDPLKNALYSNDIVGVRILVQAGTQITDQHITLSSLCDDPKIKQYLVQTKNTTDKLRNAIRSGDFDTARQAVLEGASMKAFNVTLDLMRRHGRHSQIANLISAERTRVRHEEAEAFAMARHSRLGENSPAQVLPAEIFDHICGYL